MTAPTSILDGVGPLIDAWCGLSDTTRYGTTDRPRYVSKQAAIDLSQHGGPLGASTATTDTTELFGEILEKIASNHTAGGGGNPSDVLWDLRKELSLNPDNPSPEKILEKLVVQLLGDEWSNQVATASGLIPNAGKLRHVDLVHDCGDGVYEFIELKYGAPEQGYGSDNPLYAAWEIVLYGLLFVYARSRQLGGVSNPLMQAKTVHLVVLAPDGFYQHGERGGPDQTFNLRWLEQAINQALASDDLEIGFTMDFAFQKLTKEFEAIYCEPLVLPVAAQAFRKANLTTRTRVYGS